MFLEFTRRRYLKTLLALFSALFLYCLARLVLQGLVPRLNADGIKSAVLIYILVYQGLQASGIFQKVSLAAVFLLVIGCIFHILHWPGALAILCVSFGITFIALCIDSIHALPEKRTELILLLFPLTHAAYLFSETFFPAVVNTCWMTETGVLFALGSYLFFTLFGKSRDTETVN